MPDKQLSTFVTLRYPLTAARNRSYVHRQDQVSFFLFPRQNLHVLSHLDQARTPPPPRESFRGFIDPPPPPPSPPLAPFDRRITRGHRPSWFIVQSNGVAESAGTIMERRCKRIEPSIIRRSRKNRRRYDWQNVGRRQFPDNLCTFQFAIEAGCLSRSDALPSGFIFLWPIGLPDYVTARLSRWLKCANGPHSPLSDFHFVSLRPWRSSLESWIRSFRRIATLSWSIAVRNFASRLARRLANLRGTIFLNSYVPFFKLYFETVII